MLIRMTSCAVVSMTFHGKYGYIRLLRYLASPYILYRLGKRVTQRTLVTLNVFLRKTAHLNPLHPPYQGDFATARRGPCGTFYLHCSRLLRYLASPYILYRLGRTNKFALHSASAYICRLLKGLLRQGPEKRRRKRRMTTV